MAKRGASKTQPVLAIPEDIRTRVLDAPDDDDAWDALAAWVRSQRIETRHLVDRDAIDPSTLERAEAEELFGKTHAAIIATLQDPQWRAGHIFACKLDPTSRRYDRSTYFKNLSDHLREIAAAPAFACLHALDVTVHGSSDLEYLAPLAPQLRSLRVVHGYRFNWRYARPWFERCTRLQSLTLAFDHEEGAIDGCLAHVGHIVLDAKRPLSVLGSTLTGLRSIQVDLMLCDATAIAGAIAQLAKNAPSLFWLRVRVAADRADVSQADIVLDALERSDLRQRLRHLILFTGEHALTMTPPAAWRGGAFAHLDQLEVSARYARRIGVG